MTQRRHRQFANFPKLAWLVAALALGDGAACSGDAGGNAARRVTLTGRGDGGVPIALSWVAFQDGDGPWQRATDTGGVYTFEAPSGRYTAAFVCNVPGGGLGEIIAATVAELDTIQIPCPLPVPGAITHHWQGAIKGAPANGPDNVLFGSREGGLWAASDRGDGGYQVDLAPGTYDLVASFGSTISIKRDLDVHAPGTADIDFTGGTVTAKPQPLPMLATATGEIVEAGSFFVSPRGARIELPGSKTSVGLLDPGDLAAGDTQQIYVDVRGEQGAFRGLTRSVPGGPPPALTVPPAWSGVTASVAAATPMLRPKLNFDPYPNARFYQAQMFTDMPQDFVWLLNVGAAWLSGKNSFELPDLSAIAGFDAAWGLRRDVAVAIAAVAIVSTRPIGPVLDDRPPTGPGDEISYGKKLLTLAARP
jgi:hypothetical protein